MLKARRISDNNKFIEKPPLKTIVIRPVWLCGCVFFKTQLQPFGYKKKKAVYYSLGPIFFMLETQYLQSKNCLLFLHCSRNCTVQWTVQLTWTVQNDALFMLKIVNSAILLHCSLALRELFYFLVC